MAEKTILVCDVCGQPASESVSIKIGRRTLTKDLCDVHLAELTAAARPARRGRRKGATVAAVKKRSPDRPRKSAATAASPRRRPGRPRKTKAAVS